MAHQIGADLGGARTLTALKGRCFVSSETGCWHLRTGDGKPLARGIPTYSVWSPVHRRKVAATKLAWLLANPGQELPPGHVAFRTCDSHDCVNPKHLQVGTRSELGQHLAETGKATTEAKARAARVTARSRSVLSDELLAWLLESRQSHVEAAHGLGITPSRAQQLRAPTQRQREKRVSPSVFNLGRRPVPAGAAACA